VYEHRRHESAYTVQRRGRPDTWEMPLSAPWQWPTELSYNPPTCLNGFDLAALIARGRERRLSLRELEREYILEIVHETGGNKLRAAEILRVDRKTLYRKLDEYRAEDPTLEI